MGALVSRTLRKSINFIRRKSSETSVLSEGMMSPIVIPSLSARQEHELLDRLESGGFNSAHAERVIEWQDNDLAKDLILEIRESSASSVSDNSDMYPIVTCTWSVHQQHEFLSKLEAAGLTPEDAQKVIDDKDGTLVYGLKVRVRMGSRKEFVPPTSTAEFWADVVRYSD